MYSGNTSLLRVALAIILILSIILTSAPRPAVQPPQSGATDPAKIAEISAPSVEVVRRVSDSSLTSTFTRDESIASDGRRQLTISGTALYYQDKNGSWQPIDPRFTATESGFANFTNALKLAAGEHSATLNLQNGETLIQWQPLELILTKPSDPSTPLAQVLDPASAAPGILADDHRTVRYFASWTQPGLVEEVTAAPGAVEQRLIFDAPPLGAKPGEAEANLALIATLRLPPQTQLFANGLIQPGAFTTRGRVEIRTAAGKTALVFDPVIAYEQNAPAVQTAGEYTLTPIGEGEWQVAVQTSWAWWTDPARTYPVVLDPTMKMLGPITTAQMCSYYASSPCPLTGSVDPDNGAGVIYIGRSYQWGVTEALIRFDNLPTLPNGYVVEQADLLIAPYNYIVGNGSTSITRQIRVWQVTSAWDPATVYYLNNDPAIASPHLDQKYLVTGYKPAFPASAEAFATRFHLQSDPGGLVSGWLSGAVPNHGLLLEEPFKPNCLGCKDFAMIYTDPLWTKNDIRNLDPGKPFPLAASEGSGIMLQITYAPPTLALNQPQFNNLPTFGEIYADTYHAYLPPSSASTWTAIAVKGLEEVPVNDDVLDQPTGNLRLARGCTDPFDSSCAVKTSQGAFTERPNFILARGNPASTDLEAWVYPSNPETPANASLDTYLIDAVPSSSLSGNPTLTPGTRITQTVIMSTAEIMQLYNLNLQANTRLGVRVLATANAPELGGEVEMPFIEARLFPPTTSGNTLVKDKDGQFIGGHTNFGAYEMGKIKVNPSQGGTWALGLEYFGSVDPTIGDPPITFNHPITMSLEVVLLACASNAIPALQGCLTVSKPTISTAFIDVGNFRVFSEAGFNCSGTYCETILPGGPGAVAPAIVWRADWIGGQQDRWVAVAGDPIAFDTASLYFWTNGNTWLAVDPGSGVDMLELFSGPTMGFPGVNNPGDPTFARLIPQGSNTYAAPPLSSADAANLQINANVDRQTAEAVTTLTRQVKTSAAGLEDFTFRLGWEVQAEGYAATLANQTLTPISVPPDAEVASLTLLFGTAWDTDYTDIYMPNGRFTNLRNLPGSFGDGGAGAKVAAPASLGSNWKGVTALLLPVGENLPDSDAGCPGDCLDIRAANDTPSNPNRTWGLPDLVISGQAQTLFFNRPGELTVFSGDHPNAANAVSVPFSFRTFEGDVTVDVKVCPNSGNSEKVVVITGQSKIALPGLGSDTNPATMIGATFILCETKLHEVSLEFHGPPDIPVGSTGILVNYVKGDVLIGPSNTKITFDLEYHDNGNIVDGAGQVTINTAGLFDLQTSGEVLAKVDYNGHAWVSWNPLDVGVDVQAWYSSWLTGNVHAHLWKGQGWQNKYHWLPNDNATHFAGSIAASIEIDAGQAFSWEFIEIPPWDITFSITVAFGQFCKNSGCSKYEWGLKGKFEVIGYDVGFFYGFDSGFDFILGSDGHVLIDQYAALASNPSPFGGGEPNCGVRGSGGCLDAPTSAGQPLALTRLAVADPLAATITHPLNVTAFTGSFIAGLTWSQGAPTLTLIRPDAVEITPANAASYGITVVPGAASTLYGVPNPMPGTWQAKITNTAANNDYHFAWFANKSLPDVQLLTPSGTVNLTANNTQYNLQWAVPATPPGVDLRLSLYYTVTNSTALTSTQTLGGVIRENIPLSDGSYNWDLASLAYGDYQVYARVYNGQPGNEPIQPAPTLAGTNQIPGEAWITAPGVIHLQDSAAPEIPAGLVMVPISNGFWACWAHNSEKDLSGYVVRYFSPDVYGNYLQHDLRIHAEVVEPNTWQQCARLGGFNAGENIMVQIAAYDASGNLGAFSDMNEALVENGTPTAPPGPGELSVVVVATNQVELNWEPVDLPPGGGVWLYFSHGLPLGNGQVDAPVDLGDVDSITLGLLDPGFFWFFAVQTHDDWARLSAPSVGLPVLVSNYVDGDGDELPDDWEAAYEVSDPNLDEDGDGLINIEELSYGTHPHHADTDGDEFSDGAEIVGGSAPWDVNSTPATYENFTSGLLPLPDLSVAPGALIFHAYTSGFSPALQQVRVSNVGGGVLSPAISDNATWLITLLDGETLNVSVNKNGLPAGHYTAVIAIAGEEGSLTQNSPQMVKVDLWLLEGPPPGGVKIYLPIIGR
jgi:hypothetical protein